MLKIVFFGSPAYAVPTLAALLAHPNCDVQAVVTQPDKLAGRGKLLTPSAVKLKAMEHGILCFQPERLKTEAMQQALTELAPDLFVTIAYGKILRQSFLDIPKIAPLNLHASLLPELRGAAPIQWALMRGFQKTGVCLMRMDAGMDTGPVYARRSLDISPRETAASLHDKLSALSAELLMDELFNIASGKVLPQEQSGEPSLAPMIEKSLGGIDFDCDARDLDALCRGLNPWPMAYVRLGDKRVSFLMTQASEQNADALPGTVVGFDVESKSLKIACASGLLLVESLQIEGKKATDGLSFYHGYHPERFVPWR